MRRLLRGEPAVWALLLCLSATMAAVSFGYGITKEGGQVGPGFLPLASGVALALISAACLLQSVRAAPSPDDTDTDTDADPARLRTLWTVFGLLLAALLLVPLTGFLVAFGLLVFAVSAFVEKQRLLSAAIVAVVATLVIYAVFVLFLAVPLPGGMFGVGGDG
ncbi:Tripartite tricarboxylate transporter TctB family protein [Nonomuraea solani]|uniref:Tripartite tricarboxylate transporter TctB family protein n=1 Tax=Nonomuraea solani TaxID=1144553 RepID=A0A1H5ZD35_9ACTN|nr:tripartite tricarboxylate transporter TctB family protein [Nonomuraea solani]SEG34433.1 Tripartite tricarboxylate transporter TctB family protein [Nonomuraea solani]